MGSLRFCPVARYVKVPWQRVVIARPGSLPDGAMKNTDICRDAAYNLLSELGAPGGWRIPSQQVVHCR